MTVSYSRERYEVAWRAFRERASLSEAVVAAGDRMCGDRSVLDRMALDPCTLTHGDLRLNNLMFDEAGRLAAVLDWQSVTFARGPGDLAVLLIGNLPITAAPEDEPALVRRYLAGLVEAGVRGYSVEDCWTDYRVGALAHFASMVMLSQFMDLGRNLDATAEAIVGRPVAAVERLACFELLPALPASRRIRSAGVRVLRAVKRRVAQSAGV
jgi:aminoglycoside phosphotransferase (APT) family kinase protein